jgi:pyrimidine deaminase RibD-like protein
VKCTRGNCIVLHKQHTSGRETWPKQGKPHAQIQGSTACERSGQKHQDMAIQLAKHYVSRT